MSEFNINVNSFGPGMDELVDMINLVRPRFIDNHRSAIDLF